MGLTDEEKARIGTKISSGDIKGFKYLKTNGHVKYTYRDGKWNDGEFVEEDNVTIPVMSHVLHYGQSVFEGQKAFHCADGEIRIFNPLMNQRRMKTGSERLMMPTVPEELFLKAIDWCIRGNLEYFPKFGSNCSLYIRPLLFGTGTQLAPVPAEEYIFMVLVVPVGSYYGLGKTVGAKATVPFDYDRAAPKGVGHTKSAGNYAADLLPSAEKKKLGFDIALYLDAAEHKYIEEFNTSNFVAITKDGVFITAESGSVLPSITNACMQELACSMGIKVEKRKIELLKEVESFVEVGAVGTAVVLTPIGSLSHEDKTWEFSEMKVLQKLYDAYTNIQWGNAPDKFGWMRMLGDS